MKVLRLAVIALAVVGCPKPPPPEVEDASVPAEVDAGVDAGAVDAGPEPLRFTLALDLVDAGTLVLDGLDAGETFEPIAALTLSFPAPLEDVRVRVMDWTDAVVPSDDEQTVDGGFSYRITFTQPLKTGRGYSLLVDAETGDTFRDARGTEHAELRLPFRISGDVQPEPGKPAKKPKKKKR